MLLITNNENHACSLILPIFPAFSLTIHQVVGASRTQNGCIRSLWTVSAHLTNIARGSVTWRWAWRTQNTEIPATTLASRRRQPFTATVHAPCTELAFRRRLEVCVGAEGSVGARELCGEAGPIRAVVPWLAWNRVLDAMWANRVVLQCAITVVTFRTFFAVHLQKHQVEWERKWDKAVYVLSRHWHFASTFPFQSHR